MRSRSVWTVVQGGVILAAIALITLQTGVAARQAPRVAIDTDDIGGVVTGPKGPEAGVWVIAETDDLGTKYRKIVVTDDQGRYVLPDLPNANYTVWVRGYGLVDSRKVTARRGQQLALTAVPAPDARTAAQIYPPNYWLSLLKIPDESQFPMGNVQTQANLVQQIKNMARFQIGDKATRELNPKLAAFGFKTTTEALRYYSTAGQVTEMNTNAVTLPLFADWIDRIAAGAVPEAPPRPAGLERNIVITLWDVSNTMPFIHDVVSTDKRNPRVNPSGKVYGVEFHNDGLVVLDPKENVERTVPIPAQIDKSKMRTFTRQQWENPSLTWGDETIARDHSNPNHVTMDGQGRVWMSAAVNVIETPAFCREGSPNKFAQFTPIAEADRHIAMFDPKTEKFTLIHTCFDTHHVQMAVDGTNRLFANPAFGWIDIDVLDKTGDHEKAQGWCGRYFDTDGDGRPNKDRPVPGGAYSVIQSPADGSLWGAQPGTPGHFVRLSLGANPPETCVAERYQVPFVGKPSETPGTVSGFLPRGIDIETTGVVWSGLAGSGHLASFDRRKCKGPLTGEAATTAQHCPEGWTLYPTPGPRMQGVTAQINSDYHYYNFVDQHDALGMGRDTPITNGTNSDSLLALDKRTGRVIVLRVPYPLGFYTRGLDGRIDDPNAGWKGRGLWAGNGTRTIWHTETGIGSRGHVAQFQMRPDPLAK